MYKIASQNLQHAARPKKVPTFARGENFEITPEEERDSLKSRIKQVETELLQLPRGDKRRVELGLLKHNLQNRINEIRPKATGPRDLKDYFIDVAREMLPRYTFNALITESTRRAGVEPVEQD